MFTKNCKSLVIRLGLILALLGELSGVVQPRQVLAASGDLTRVSVSSDGTQGNATSGSTAITPDGRYIAFNSSATNLVAGDSNGQTDVFLHDRQTGETKRISVSSSGVQANNYSRDPSISADGRYIAFYSSATNLVSGDTNNLTDIFLHDTQTGSTTRVSVVSNGAQANGSSGYLSISADGRYIAFVSAANNLVIDDTNGKNDIFVHDNQTGATTRVSVDSTGVEGNDDSNNPFVSADGRYVTFHSDAANLIGNDTNAKTDVFVHDRQTGITTRVSVDSSGMQGDNSSFVPSISVNNRYVAFGSSATNLVSQDTNAKTDIFIHDRQTGVTSLVSRDSNGHQANASSYNPIISADGRFIAFNSGATNLVSGDKNGESDVFVHDRQTGKTIRVSVTSDNREASGGSSDAPSISSDGLYIAFDSSATNLASGDTNASIDAFVRENDITVSPNLHIVSKTADTNDGICDEDCSLREAVVAASAGDLIVFNTLLAGQTIRLTYNLVIAKDLTIDGSDLSSQVIVSGEQMAHWEIPSGSTVIISDVTITNGNYGIMLRGDLTIINSTLKNNRDYSGGALNSYGGTLTIKNSTITQNHSDYGGGAFYLYSGTAKIINSTIAGNDATLFGGGIVMDGGAAVEVINSTFAGNSAPHGAEISLNRSNGSLTALAVSNSVFACTQTSGNCYDYPPSSVTSTSSIIAAGTLADFGLTQLADHGGPTQTMALLPESSLIGAGSDSVCASSSVNNLDQRGAARPRGVHCDIGAYEYYDGVLSVGDTTRVSVNSGIVEGNNTSAYPSVSAGGRYVAFESNASNLVSDDTNGTTDIFIHEVQTGSTKRASIDSNGAQANGASHAPSISADGRYITFVSAATNLVSDDTNGVDDIFLYDMQTGMTTRLSVDSNGVQGNKESSDPSISSDGRYVAFKSNATNLVSGSISSGHIFLRDMQTDVTMLVSVTSSGAPANYGGYTPSISADGRYIAFGSTATDLVPNDTNGNSDIFVHDMQTGVTTRVSVDSAGAQANGISYAPSISGDGRYVVFYSFAENLVADDTNYKSDVFLRDTQMDMTRRVSVTSTGTQSRVGGQYPSISTDGRYVVYDSLADDLVAGDTNWKHDIFVHDVQAGATTRVSLNSNGGQTDDSSYAPSISPDGCYIAFYSYATNLVENDTNSATDVFIHRQDSLPLLTPIHYVKWDADGANNGTSWADAHTDLQFALAAASVDDEIWVAAGTYTPTTDPSDRAATFQLRNGIAIYGGFAGTETARDQRDLAANVTILSGDIDGNDSQKPIITDLTTVTGNITNSYHVVMGADHATLDGFTITAGYADGDWGINADSGAGLYNYLSEPVLTNLIFIGNLAGKGGGISNKESSPTLSNITFNGNRATSWGGGMENRYSHPGLTDVTFTGNSADTGGGGMDNYYSNPTLTNVTFSKNSLTYEAGTGGGMGNNHSDPVLTNVIFSENSPTYMGGGMDNYYSNPILTDVTFYKNSATNGGGGMVNRYSSPTLTDVTFSENSAVLGGGIKNYFSSSPTLMNVTFTGNSARDGGGMENHSNSSPLLTNVTFVGNSASTGGGMLIRDNSSPTLTNVTFSSNVATGSGGGMYIYNDSNHVQIRNSIFWDNLPNTVRVSPQYNPSTLGISDSVLQDGCPTEATCTNVIAADPMLRALGYYGGGTQTIPLLPGSSAIDAGDDSNCPDTDQRGVTRPQGSHCDIGAYEYEPTTTIELIVTADDQTIVYGDSDPTFTFNYSGFQSGDDETDIETPPTCSVSGVHSDAGAYPITCTGAVDSDGLYVFTYVSGSLTVNQATPTLLVNNSPVSYNGSAQSADVIGSVAGTVSDIRYDGSATAPVDPGTYAVTADFVPDDITNYTSLTDASAGNFVIESGLTTTLKSMDAQDGWILESSETSNQGGTLNSIATVLYVGDNAQDKQYRSLLSFDTSSLPEDAVITNVQLKIRVQGFVGDNMFTPAKTHGNLLMDIRDPYYGTSVDLVASDFQAGASKNNVGVLTSAPTTGWYTVTLKDTSYPFIDLEGTTQFRLRFQTDDNNDNGADYLKIYSGNAPVASRPQLIIEYYVP